MFDSRLMTLEEFRRNWLPDHADAAPAPASPVSPSTPAARRLVFVPPQETELVPRLIFREVFAAPGVERKPRLRARDWGIRILWTLAAFLATGATGFGMAKVFEYAPTYIEEYVSGLN